VAGDGTIPGTRWLVDHDGQLKLTLAECAGCHSRLLPDGTVVRGAQMNLNFGSLAQVCFDAATEINRRENRSRPPNEVAYESYGVPWLGDDVNARLKARVDRVLANVVGLRTSATLPLRRRRRRRRSFDHRHREL
jgi:hypothetical protein